MVAIQWHWPPTVTTYWSLRSVNCFSRLDISSKHSILLLSQSSSSISVNKKGNIKNKMSFMFQIYLNVNSNREEKREKMDKRKKSGEKKKGMKKNKPPADFKPLQWVLLVFIDATGRGGLATSLYSLPIVLWGWGPGLGHYIQSCPASSPGHLWASRLKSATQFMGS